LRLEHISKTAADANEAVTKLRAWTQLVAGATSELPTSMISLCQVGQRCGVAKPAGEALIKSGLRLGKEA
jgi:hypothetical protein